MGGDYLQVGFVAFPRTTCQNVQMEIRTIRHRIKVNKNGRIKGNCFLSGDYLKLFLKNSGVCPVWFLKIRIK